MAAAESGASTSSKFALPQSFSGDVIADVMSNVLSKWV